MGNRLPINWSFAGISLLFIILTGSILYFANNVTQKRQSTTSKAAGNQCIDGIVTDSIQFLKPDGTVIQNGSTVDSLTGIRCKLRVSGIPEADKHNVCGIKINDAWPVGCPNVIPETDWIHENIYTWDTDVTTTFLRCDQSLANVPAGAKLQAVVARFYPNGTNCVWTDPSQFIPGPQIFFQSTGNPTTQPTAQPTTDPSVTPTPIPVCTSNQCNICILNNRSDILKFYKDNGWDVSCNNQDAIVNNWCGIDPAACNGLKSNQCAAVCQTTCPRANLGNLSCDGQGCINNEDLTIFRTYFGKPGNIGNFFSDQSGIIDTGDYEILRQNFGTCNIN